MSYCNNGTPLIQFGNGSGKKVFIVAGVHGNELASQAAAFKLINSIYNSKSKLSGTVYIIPVLCPKSTALNQRYYNGVNLNGVADKKGTISYKLVQYAKSLKVNAVGDFHCTRPVEILVKMWLWALIPLQHLALLLQSILLKQLAILN